MDPPRPDPSRPDPPGSGPPGHGLPHRHAPARPTIVDLLRLGTLDAELAAILWLLLDARTPLFVAGATPAGMGPGRLDRRILLQVLLDLLPPTARRIPVDPSGAGLERLTSGDAAAAWLTDLDLGPEPAYGVRLAFRSLSRGAVMAASIQADSLENVLRRLRAPDIRLDDDELSFLGVVVVLRAVRAADGEHTEPAAPARVVDRVVAAHYLRPIARDPAGHVQRLPPAVLAAWEPVRDELEHYAWGLTAELAGRTGLRPGDIEPEVERRRTFLAGLADAGLAGSNQLRTALDGYRFTDRPGQAG